MVVPSETQLQPGSIVLGKYRVDRVIGSGGMGVVLGATHVELDDRVAIKVLHPEGIHQAELVTRFVREAQAAASLRSENVVRVFDVGRLDDGAPYMVMEWLEGLDLASGPVGEDLPISEAVDYVIQACDAMIVAHGRGMVHRDLKPANLFLVTDQFGIPTVKVLDFGISKLMSPNESQITLTEARQVMGSPQYMSPEQVKSARDVDARSDIWALGTILYELITGEPPFSGESLGGVFLAIATEAAAPMRSRRDGVPKPLETVVARCLHKQPDRRYASAQELQLALLPFGSVRSQARMAIRTSTSPPGRGDGSGRSSASLAERPASALPTHSAWAGTAGGAGTRARFHSRRAKLLVVGAFGSLSIAAGIWWLLRAPSAQAPSAAATGPSPMADGTAKPDRGSDPSLAGRIPAPRERHDPSLALSRGGARGLPSAITERDRPGTSPVGDELAPGAERAGSVRPPLVQAAASRAPAAARPHPAASARPTASARPPTATVAARGRRPQARPTPSGAGQAQVQSNPLDIGFK